MSERFRGMDVYEFGDLRHEASKNLTSGTTLRTDGLLTPAERKLCKEEGMVLPRPIRPNQLNEDYWMRIYDLDRWMCRIGATVDGNPAFGVHQREGSWDVPERPVFVIDGTFDVVHGGQYKLAKTAINLAETNGGYVYVLIQDNQYIWDYKNKLPIFDELTRSAWFWEFSNRIDAAIIWHQSKSWETGYQILGSLMNFQNKKNVFFVLPDASSHLPSREGYALWRREMQIKEAGFSVAEVHNTYQQGTSSSILRKKFDLKPTPEVLEWAKLNK